MPDFCIFAQNLLGANPFSYKEAHFVSPSDKSPYRPRLNRSLEPIICIIQNLPPEEVLHRLQSTHCDNGAHSVFLAGSPRISFPQWVEALADKDASAGDAANQPPAPLEMEGDYTLDINDERGTGELTGKKSPRILSLDQLLAASRVDLDIWYVERYVVNKWDQNSDKKGLIELFQVKAWLKRRDDIKLREALALKEDILRDMQLHAPHYPAIHAPKLIKYRGERYMQEISPFDLHVGKLAWGEETGEDYDSKIASERLEHVMEDLLSKAEPFHPDEYLFPIGNDLIHTDNRENNTNKGTRQDADSRHPKMFRLATQLMIQSIDRLYATGKRVRVVVVPGNHDLDAMFKLGEVISAWYRDCAAVEVDNSPKLRKYIAYGATLLGFTHGNDIKHNTLPQLMAVEEPQLWSMAKHREWHLGHYHKSKETQYIAGDTHNGVRVRILPSLSGDDFWHYSQGYVKGQRSAESYLYEHSTGYTGHFSSNIVSVD